MRGNDVGKLCLRFSFDSCFYLSTFLNDFTHRNFSVIHRTTMPTRIAIVGHSFVIKLEEYMWKNRDPNFRLRDTEVEYFGERGCRVYQLLEKTGEKVKKFNPKKIVIYLYLVEN